MKYTLLIDFINWYSVLLTRCLRKGKSINFWVESTSHGFYIDLIKWYCNQKFFEKGLKHQLDSLSSKHYLHSTLLYLIGILITRCFRQWSIDEHHLILLLIHFTVAVSSHFLKLILHWFLMLKYSQSFKPVYNNHPWDPKRMVIAHRVVVATTRRLTNTNLKLG